MESVSTPVNIRKYIDSAICCLMVNTLKEKNRFLENEPLRKYTFIPVFPRLLNEGDYQRILNIILPKITKMVDCFIASMILFLIMRAATAHVVEKDRPFLMEFHKAPIGKLWITTLGFKTPLSGWRGIALKGCYVPKLVLPVNNLIGYWPESLFELKHLEEPNLLFNRIKGKVFSRIGEAQSYRS